MKIDLHIHTTYSDGKTTVKETLKRIGEDAIFAFADHDTFEAAIEYLKTNKENNKLKFITGTEITTKLIFKEKELNLHILGYCFNPKNPELYNALKDLRNTRKERTLWLIGELKTEVGLNPTKSEVDQIANCSFPHTGLVMELLVKHKIASTMQEARTIIKKLKKQADYINAKTAIELIVGAGGFAVLAHPTTLIRDGHSYRFIKKLVKHLKTFGLLGMEVYFSENSEKDMKKFRKMAKKLKMLKTAGSDFHGGKNLNAVVPHEIFNVGPKGKHFERDIQELVEKTTQ
ncbi:MAG: PHP domain-containing protein [Firmicutes bacterium]|nr:PHP domain-containing protein [Bacillota bacterium]MCL2771574.1 PHP domain-containing protein [Bacillota bacterium]